MVYNGELSTLSTEKEDGFGDNVMVTIQNVCFVRSGENAFFLARNRAEKGVRDYTLLPVCDILILSNYSLEKMNREVSL